MLRYLLSRLKGLLSRDQGSDPDSPSPTPADPIFWRKLGHTETRARQIAECFPEYWEKLGSRHSARNARYCFARQVGDAPLHWKYPASPKYADTEDLPETDPLMWCCVNGHNLYSLELAVEIAVLAAKIAGNPNLKPHREKWLELRWGRFNHDRKRFRFSATRTPTNPLFWRQLGHNPIHARRLVRCCPEYWFKRTQCSWNEAIRLATRTLHRLAARLETRREHYYELAETEEYDIAKRDPAHWYLQGCDWDESLQKVIKESFREPSEGCRRILEVRDQIRKAGRRSELLRDGAIHVRGPALGYQREHERIQETRRAKSANEVNAVPWPRWGPLELDTDRAATAHCCAIGPRRHGIDTLLRILMTSVASQRWLVFDGSNDLFPAIKAIRPNQQISLLNPLDARSCAWNIAEDAATSQQAQEVVAAVLPPDAHHDATLLEIARAVLVAVIDALSVRAPGAWRLLHLIAALEGTNLEAVLRSNPATTKLYETLSSHPHFRLITSFLQSRLQPLKPTAAAWRHAPGSISITAWTQSRFALVLPNSFSHQHVLGPLNRILFQLAASRLVGHRSVSLGQTWVFLSDLCQIGRLEALSTMLSQGPTAGLTVAMTLEDVEILQRHYGPETKGILGLCGNYAFLRITNPITTRWASQLLGVEKVRVCSIITGHYAAACLRAQCSA